MSTVELVPVGALFSPARVAVAGFLAGYSGRTREAYALDVRMFGYWCTERHVDCSAVTRAHIELYARWLEEQGRARATIARRLSTIVSFYRYAEEEHLIAQSPAVHVRRPKLDYESRAVGLDRNEIGALLVAAGLGPAGDHALISLLALNGLRISEALGVNVEDLAVERGHRTLRVVRKGGKTVTIPLAPRTARAIDLAVGERVEGPIFLSVHGERLDRTRRRARCDGSPDGPGSPNGSVLIRCVMRSSPPLSMLGPAARRPRSRLARRSTHDDVLRPGSPVPRPARDLHRRRLRRRRRPLTDPHHGRAHATCGPSKDRTQTLATGRSVRDLHLR